MNIQGIPLKKKQLCLIMTFWVILYTYFFYCIVFKKTLKRLHLMIFRSCLTLGDNRAFLYIMYTLYFFFDRNVDPLQVAVQISKWWAWTTTIASTSWIFITTWGTRWRWGSKREILNLQLPIWGPWYVVISSLENFDYFKHLNYSF